MIIKDFKEQLKYISNEKRFIASVISKKLVIQKRLESDIIKDLQRHKFDRKDKSYNYLLDMPLRRFTITKIKELQKRLLKLETELENISQYEPKDMWLDEIKDFLSIYKIK